MSAELQIEYISIAELKPWPKNARTHSRKQVRQIADSITTFGFTNPVLIDEGDTILAGHGRVEAAKLIGIAEVPCMVASGYTEAEKRAYIIADNKLAQNAGWDHESLAIELPSFDVSAAGDVAPTLSDLTLQLVVDRPIAIRDGFLMLDGALEGVADLTE